MSDHVEFAIRVFKDVIEITLTNAKLANSRISIGTGGKTSDGVTMSYMPPKLYPLHCMLNPTLGPGLSNGCILGSTIEHDRVAIRVALPEAVAAEDLDKILKQISALVTEAGKRNGYTKTDPVEYDMLYSESGQLASR